MYYEFKENNGSIISGYNLINIDIVDKCIILTKVDNIRLYSGIEKHVYKIILDINEIKYIKIKPMLNELKEVSE